MADELKPESTAPPAEATTAAPAVESQQAETPAQSPFVQTLSKLGFENVSDEKEGFQRLADAYSRLKEDTSAQIRQALAELKQSHQPEPPQTQAEGSSWWKPPAVDEALASRFRTPDGNWKEGTPPEIRQSVEALEAYRTRFASQLVADPKTALAPLLKEFFAEQFKEQYSQVSAQEQERRFFAEVQSKHDWIWEKDPVTQRHTQRFTPEGAQFNEKVIELEGRGLTTQDAFTIAMELREARKAVAKQPTAQEVSQVNEQKKLDLLHRAAPGLQRAGSLPKPGTDPPRNRNLSFGQQVLQEMQSRGPSSSPA